MNAYASGTTVSVEKSRAEIDTLLGRHGAAKRGLITEGDAAIVAFEIGGLRYRLDVPLPVKRTPLPADEPRGWRGWGQSTRELWIDRRHDQLCRERWRQLLLLLRAKLEAVRLGLSTVEKEFLADLVLESGQSVYQAMGERIALALAHGQPLALPPAGGT